MLGKLMKYEFRATARTFLPFYIGLLFVALVNCALNKLHSALEGTFNTGFGILSFLAGTLYFLVIAATFVITLVVIIQRFYRNLLCDEGYLMFTLPVKPAAHIWAKLLTATVWTILSVIVAIASIMILVYGLSFDFGSFFSGIGQFYNALIKEPYAILFLLLFAVFIIAAIFASILQIYASMALGQLAGKHRVLLSFAAYLGINTVIQAATMIVLITGASLLQVEAVQEFFRNLLSLGSPEAAVINTVLLLLCMSIIGMLAICAVCYLITRIILTKKLNLE